MIDFSCRHYKASRPCVFNKTDGSECPSCTHVSNFKQRVLFIKLDAIGDVLRSASLLPDIVARHEAPYIAWLTRKDSIELVGMMKYVDEVIELSEIGMARVMTGSWDYVYSLSNDLASASIASAAPAKNLPVGYYVRGGNIEPSNAAARHWLEMAAFDRLKRQNKQSYQHLMRAILGLNDAAVARPALELASHLRIAAGARVSALFPGSTRRRVAVNVGAGGRWPKKMLTIEQIHQYVDRLLTRADVDIMIVGGAAEVEKTKSILTICGSNDRVRPALTETSIPEFVAVLAQADALLCGDTLALHIATAMCLPTVAVFGPTSIAEIPDFDGLIAKVATPALDCLGCYGDCAKQDNCMSLLDLDHLIHLTVSQLARPRPA
jgi:heptosyltransferase-1